MNSHDTSKRAIEWLELQLTDLAGIRNATPRDPSFKNWRQATLTVMQRIWPGDVARSDRFRRITFTSPDPRADARVVREWYGRGCLEAARVLRGYVDEIHASGVAQTPGGPGPEPQVGGFADDFPTVDLPAGDLGASTSTADMTENMLAELADAPPQGSAASSQVPPQLQLLKPPVTATGPGAPAPAKSPKKGLSVKARLRDLLGFAQLSAKALAGFPLDMRPPEPPVEPTAVPRAELGLVAPAAGAGQAPPPFPRKLQEPPTPSRSWPMLQRPASGAASAPPAASGAPGPAPSATAAPAWPVPPSSAGEARHAPPVTDADLPASTPSAILSRSTTLRANIEKVSMDALIDPAFRTSAGGEAPPAGANASPAALPAPGAAQKHGAGLPPPAPRPHQRPSLRLVRPVFDDPEFSAEPRPGAELETPDQGAVEPAPPASSGTFPGVRPPASRIVPLPILPAARAPLPGPDSRLDPDTEFGSEAGDTAASKLDPDAFARATDEFMSLSPVLGATGRRVQRGFDDPIFGDPDAIAVGAMVQDLARMGVPVERQPEVRARLLDLARRMERGELEWSALRKAVWFAMDYPELARRLIPVLLPWIDRAA